ncbi:HEPN domain-containing protein [Photobacterium swingsii]|uniref:HEPN domain-containing protein n=1 Tax=Photobacterium swingsii TaxID=680026 RepID=UPI0040697F53
MSNPDPALAAVERLYSDYTNYHSYLMNNAQVSFASEYKSQFSKVILLSSASYFENKVIKTILAFLNPNDCVLTNSFIENKALTRQYHTLFDWNKKNANKFFSYFGNDFKSFMENKVSNDATLKTSISNFMELGDLRNQLAHNDYAMFHLQLTPEEIFDKFQSAQIFINSINSFASEFTESP